MVCVDRKQMMVNQRIPKKMKRMRLM